MRTQSQRLIVATIVAAAAWGVTPAAAAEPPKVGAPAPEFSATDIDGHEHHLADFNGKYVVLEWHNQGCPFVKKHYDSGNMQRLQKELTSQGATWLTVISSAPGKQGHVTAEEEKSYLSEKQAAPTAVLVDADGKLGHLYGAKTTPHMFVIDDKGTLIYAGAIDDKASPDQADIANAKNFVRTAFQESKAGKPVSVSATAPYGCGVKYKD